MSNEIKPGDHVLLLGDVALIQNNLATVVVRSTDANVSCRLVLSSALMQPADMIAMASAYDVLPYDPKRYSLRIMQVVRRSHDPETWAIINDGNFCLSRDHEWEPESRPSWRTEDFLARCRWSSARQAVQFAQDHLRLYPTGL